jgi:hypothetical protein
LAKIAVSAANTADNKAQSCHEEERGDMLVAQAKDETFRS